MISIFKEEIFRKYFLQFGLLFIASMVIGIILGMYILPHAVSEVATNYMFETSASAQFMNLAEDNLLYTFIATFVNNAIVSLIFAILFPVAYYSARDNIDKIYGAIWFMKVLFFIQMLLIWVVIGYAIPIINNNLLSAIALLPHGIIEIPALLIAAALGAWFIETQMDKLTRIDLCKLFAVYVIPLLLVAAVIETYITPVLMGMVV
jgi:stage II sporulation protein M